MGMLYELDDTERRALLGATAHGRTYESCHRCGTTPGPEPYTPAAFDTQQLGRDQRYSPSIQRFVTAMYRSVEDHLRALVMYIRANAKLVDAIRVGDSRSFARIYNGPAFSRNKYDLRLDSAGFAAVRRLAGQ